MGCGSVCTCFLIAIYNHVKLWIMAEHGMYNYMILKSIMSYCMSYICIYPLVRCTFGYTLIYNYHSLCYLVGKRWEVPQVRLSKWWVEALQVYHGSWVQHLLFPFSGIQFVTARWWGHAQLGQAFFITIWALKWLKNRHTCQQLMITIHLPRDPLKH